MLPASGTVPAVGSPRRRTGPDPNAHGWALREDRSVSETEWAIPEAAQPKVAEFAFDLDRTLTAILQLRSEIPADAFTASILGTERAGNGVMIGADGLVLT